MRSNGCQDTKGRIQDPGKITFAGMAQTRLGVIEEGFLVPSLNDPSRYERGVLGDYAS